MEKKQKKKRIKTVYDFNPTPDELKKLIPWVKSKEDYINNESEDSINRTIAMLHFHRNNYLRMKWYAMKIKSWDMRNSFFRTVTHP